MVYPIVQWNIKGLDSNSIELCLLIRKYKPSVIVLEETLTDSKCQKITGFNALTKSSDSDRATGGVAVLINNGHLSSEVNLNSPLQAVAATITTNRTITLCSIYLPPSEQVSEIDLTNLIDQLPSPFVLLLFFWASSAAIRFAEEMTSITTMAK